MKKITMSLLFIGLIPFSAFAENTFFLCEEDSRPFDGDYQKISIVTNESGKQDIFQSFIRGGLFPDGHESSPVENKLIAENLLCQMYIGGIECYDQINPSRVPILKLQTVWVSKEEYIKVIYNFNEIGFFNKASCN